MRNGQACKSEKRVHPDFTGNVYAQVLEKNWRIFDRLPAHKNSCLKGGNSIQLPFQQINYRSDGARVI